MCVNSAPSTITMQESNIVRIRYSVLRATACRYGKHNEPIANTSDVITC
jgi:hypothetical protein